MPGLPDSVLRIAPTGSWIFRECGAWGSADPTLGVLPTSACAQSIMTAFLADPNRDVDQSCIQQTTVPTFSLPEPHR
ncbi:hypothetical protein PJK45_13405 [Mycobacterium kansasii]|uniref:Uncharacterized protein n=3 Tax=Mycobacterium kansasii TaxID=1768 RepID=A0A1V3WJ49_MYCKA|nr:hypothetical protein [Mycobacterium kansasii]AGZ54336.1 hypothetical protein MKAN_19085 [Mycobacterium kansasii ATCC 12478]ARG56155.1 hypothetical protein B1T43_10115 [Mycobacterium kansasii]ARG61600.1 hypothetical protein B1T45_10185 [Mycobacterium kansasii]ARG69285.1 hypothetical protein B1T47_09810 [Mycobacterium kansasii]ARG76088.1 hypothetical protein B1T51_18250 [Mycobacterium kansasii]